MQINTIFHCSLNYFCFESLKLFKKDISRNIYIFLNFSYPCKFCRVFRLLTIPMPSLRAPCLMITSSSSLEGNMSSLANTH